VAMVRYIDPQKCIGCRACEVACQRVHDGISNVTVYIVEEAELNIPYACRHCENAPCVSVCPTGAMHREDLGAVVVNPVLCIGCRMCQVVCPFGIPVFDRKLKVMTKCDLCINRLKEGLRPACVSTCPTGATYLAEEAEALGMKRELGVRKIVEAVTKAKELGGLEGVVTSKG